MFGLALSPKSQQVCRVNNSSGDSHSYSLQTIKSAREASEFIWNGKSIFLSGLGISRISRSTTTCLRPEARKILQLVDVFHSFSSIHTSRLSYIRSVRYFPSSRVLYRFTIYFYVFSLSYRRVLQLRPYSSWTQQDKDFNSKATHNSKFFTHFFSFNFNGTAFIQIAFYDAWS